MIYYTYVFIDPRNGEPFYVGKGKNYRLREHEYKVLAGRKTDNLHLANKIRKIKSLGLDVIYEKWFGSEDEWFCFWAEIYLIDYFGRRDNGTGILCNLTEGGEGNPGYRHSKESKAKIGRWSSQRRHSEETKRKIGLAHKGRKYPPEFGQKIRVVKLGKPNPMKGKRHSPETRRRMSESQQRRFLRDNKRILRGECARFVKV